jgi:Zn-dependent protease
MLRFRAFGVPVFVQPAFWLTAVLLGGSIGSPGLLVLWVAIVFVSVLVHELGHVAAMRMTGGGGEIVLTAFGGLAVPNLPNSERRSHAIFISAAGPLAQIALGLAAAAAVIFAGGAVAVVTSSGTGIPYLRAMMGPDAGYTQYAVNFLLYISFFWSLLNLAPVYPLDGGQITRAFVGLRTALILSLIVAALIAAASFWSGNLFIGILFAWMGFSNVQAMTQK